MIPSVKVRTLLGTFIISLSFPAITMSEETESYDPDENIEEVLTIGSRSSKPRTATDSPVPVDVFKGEDFNRLGNSADLTDNLKTLVPSYTATPATGDGSAFVRPTSLRGMAPDQTLVLINGKRRHRSALVHFFAPAAGNGAHGPDIGMIPGIAIENVEVLRDGAAAQYGSDAIAGVINFQMKEASEGGAVQLQYGQFFEGETSQKISSNAGFQLGDSGFINISFEHTDNEALSRGLQRPDSATLIADGVQGVGADSPFADAPYAQTWGRPETSGNRFFVNSGYEIGPDTDLYLQANYGDTDGRYRFFYRNPSHSSLNSLSTEFNYNGSLLATGYTPFLDGAQTDSSIYIGLKGIFSSGLFYDFSAGVGENKLDYFLNNSTNSSLGLGVDGEPLQMDFEVGGYGQKETNLNADFTYGLSNNLNLAFGAEYREEEYTISRGEPNSYLGVGASGLSGFRPEDSGSFSRDNYSVYGDLEQDISDEWLMQYALRYENFSDFGDTINGKIATRYNLTDEFTLRSAISTGFHAPTPGQANVRTTITTFDGTTGQQVEEGLVKPTSPQAIGAGGSELKQEESVNYSFGFTSDLYSGTTLTADLYLIEVSDRIYRTGDIQVRPVQESFQLCNEADIALGCSTISFYTNALDVEHSGLDLVLTSSYDWNENITSDLSFAFNYNEIKVTDQSAIAGSNPVSDATVEDIENNFPNERFVLTLSNKLYENWHLLVRANYYGEHYDERGTIDSEDNPSAKISPITYLDLELSMSVNDSFSLAFGGLNILDEYVDQIDEPFANRQSVGLQYPRRSAANYEGGSWYFKANYRF